MLFKKYTNNITALQLFQMFRYGTLILISIFLAKSNLTTDSIGEYEFFLFFSALIGSFWINGLIQSFLPLYNDNNTFKTIKGKSPAFFNIFLLITLFSLFSIILVVIFKNLLAKALTTSNTLPYFNLILLYIFFSSPVFIIEYIYLLKNKPDYILKYGFITFSLQFILVSFPVLLGGNIEMSLKGLILISIIMYLWLMLLIKK